jgi:hypothetical protein
VARLRAQLAAAVGGSPQEELLALSLSKELDDLGAPEAADALQLCGIEVVHDDAR